MQPHKIKKNFLSAPKHFSGEQYEQRHKRNKVGVFIHEDDKRNYLRLDFMGFMS